MSQPICSKCGRPKESQASASLTQWFAVCTCDVQEPEAIREVRLCTTCGKRINEGRSGSFTQWIFRSDVCSCKQSLYASGASPAQQESTHIDFSAPSEPSIEDDEEMLVNEDIAIDAGTFPSDRYKPLTLLGCGVAGTVYLCQDKILSKKVAVKTLRERSNKQLIALQNEARACSKLKHKNIVQVLDFGVTDGGIPYMVMQYVRGESLESIKRRLRALEWRPLIMMIVELCKALAYLHENQIFHRDLKPSNILVRDANEEPPQVWLIDFGISIQAGEGNSTATLAGTPAYMSPDHAAGRAYTAASDIYSLGCIMFECLAGRPPFVGDTALDTIRLHATAEVPSIAEVNPQAELPDGLQDVIAGCLEKDPTRRISSAQDLRSALENVLDSALQPAEIVENLNDPVKNVGVFGPGPVRISLIPLVILCVFIVSIMVLQKFEPRKDPRRQDIAQAAKPVEIIDQSINPTSPYASEAEQPDGKPPAKPRPLNKIFKIRNRVCDALVHDLKDNEIKLLHGMPLVNVSLGDQPDLSDESCKELSLLPLKQISLLKSKRVTDQGLAYIAKIKTLDVLMMSETAITGAYFNRLPRKMLILIVDRTPVNDDAMKGLENMTIADRLDLTGTKVTDAGMAHMRTLKAFAVHMSGCKVTDRGFENLSENSMMHALYASDTTISDAGLRMLARAPLATLNLDSCELITDRSLGIILRQWPNMSRLLLQHTSITPQGLRQVKGFKNLIELRVSFMPYTDADLEPVYSLRTLESLDLTQTNITDKTLRKLESLPRLDQLNVSYCPNVTEPGVERARRHFHHFSDLFSGFNYGSAEMLSPVGRMPLGQGVDALR